MVKSELHKVLMVVDTESVLGKYEAGTPEKPTEVKDKNLVHFTAREKDASPGTLRIRASVLDILRWREISVSANSEHAVLLYAFDRPTGPDLISSPRSLTFPTKIPQVNRKNLLEPTLQDIHGHLWQSTVKATGSAAYPFFFLITTRQGERKGCYRLTLDLRIEGDLPPASMQ